MIDEKNKDTQNNPSTGNFGGNDKTSSGSGTSTETKDNFSASGSKSGSEGLSIDSAKETAKGLLDQARSTAGQAYGVAAEKATEKIEEKKTDLASGLTSVADTIRQVSSTLRETDEQTGVTDTAAKYSDSLAGQIEQISKYFERNDVRAMVGDIEDFARRNPVVFIGGAFALGLLAARFLKSSSSGQSSSRRLGGRNLNTPLLRARNDSTKTSNYRGMSYDEAGDFASESGSTGKSTSATSNTSPGATDYSSTSSDAGKSSTDFDSNLTGNKSTSGDKTTTNPS